jgi:hypothetical protein
MDTTTQVQPTAIELRQMEVDAYTKNIEIYQAILSTLDGNWDADLVQYRDMPSHDAARACPVDRVERLSELQQFDNLNNLVKTEMLERSKAQKILDALILLENK